MTATTEKALAVLDLDKVLKHIIISLELADSKHIFDGFS
jgi:hypothetical protein